MLNRRAFLLRHAPSVALGMAASWEFHARFEAEGDEPMRGSVYEFGVTRMEYGSQLSRLLDWTEKRALPLWVKHGFGPMAFFTVEVGPHLPALVSLRSHPSLAELEAAWTRVAADPDFSAALADLEASGPAFVGQDDALLLATPFSPPLKAAAPGDPSHKIFELRIYESPTSKQQGYLHDRFAGGEIEIFHKSGIYPILYADTLYGPHRHNMIYLIPFESEAHREKAWATFRSDPDWQKIRDESVRRGGEIVRNITNMLLAPARFSPVR